MTKINPNIAEEIKDYVNTHYELFGYYPGEIQFENITYTYGQYWSILEKEYIK